MEYFLIHIQKLSSKFRLLRQCPLQQCDFGIFDQFCSLSGSAKLLLQPAHTVTFFGHNEWFRGNLLALVCDTE